MRRATFGALAVLLLQIANANGAWEIQDREERALADGRLRYVHENAVETDRVSIDAVLFQQSELTFRVVDNPGNSLPLDEAVENSPALAGVNGGFFDLDATPLGLVISNGTPVHPLQQAKLLSGVLIVNHRGISLLRTREYTAQTKPMEALQAGPFLVDRGAPVAGLNDTRQAARTVVVSDGRGGFGLVLCRAATLAATARLLAQPNVLPEFTVTRALNLDGGSSSAFWLRKDPPFYFREWKRVRNFLVIVPRGPAVKR